MEDDRIISSSLRQEDVFSEAGIRPMTLADYTGQDKVKEKMSIFIEAAKKRGGALDHVHGEVDYSFYDTLREE